MSKKQQSGRFSRKEARSLIKLARDLGYEHFRTKKNHILFVHGVTGDRTTASGTPGLRSYSKTISLLRKGVASKPL